MCIDVFLCQLRCWVLAAMDVPVEIRRCDSESGRERAHVQTAVPGSDDKVRIAPAICTVGCRPDRIREPPTATAAVASSALLRSLAGCRLASVYKACRYATSKLTDQSIIFSTSLIGVCPRVRRRRV
jgi:hypothetical protein